MISRVGLLVLSTLFGGFTSVAVTASSAAPVRSVSAESQDLMAAATFRREALQRRGHTGDETYLQGCDLTDLQSDRHAARIKLGRAHPLMPPLPPAKSSPEELIPATVARDSASLDQELRNRLTTPTPEGVDPEAVLQLRMADMCEADLRHGQWLQSDAAIDLMLTSTDRQVLGDLLLLALHADHLPALQDQYSAIYLTRRQNLGLPIEPGLRLKDRSRINAGEPQIYATAVICEAGRAAFAGSTDLRHANLLRAALGLPPQDLAEKDSRGFCS
jgi:hypothetical protein